MKVVMSSYSKFLPLAIIICSTWIIWSSQNQLQIFWNNLNSINRMTQADDNHWQPYFSPTATSSLPINKGSFYQSNRVSTISPHNLESLMARDQDAELLKQAIVAKYLNKMQRKLTSSSETKFLAFECQLARYCGGIGDRIWGVLSAFHLALNMGHVFHLVWTRGSRLDSYFDINNAFYNISSDSYGNKLNTALKHKRQKMVYHFFDRVSEPSFLKWSSSTNLSASLAAFQYIALFSNSIFGMEGCLKNPDFTSNYDNLVSDFPLNKSLDLTIFASAVLRIIFGSPKRPFADLFEKCVLTENWTSSFRIGVQVRRSRNEWRERRKRVSESQVNCFVEKVREIILEVVAKRPATIFTVFITSDNETAASFMKQQLVSNSVSVIRSEDHCPELKINHSDRSTVKNVNDTWIEFAKSYLDWFVLTKMDRLVISRSGFGETASLLSLKPTDRLPESNSTEDKCAFEIYKTYHTS